MKEAEAQLQTSQLSNKSLEFDKQLQEAETKAHNATIIAEQAQSRVKKLEECIILAKTEINKWLDANDDAIQQLKRQLAQQQDEVRQQLEQTQELKEYICIHEDYFVEQMAKAELQKFVMQTEHDEEKQQLESANINLETNCTEMEVKYEKKRLELLVVEAKLMQAEGSTNAQIVELRKGLVVAQYHVSIGKEKVQPIVKAPKLKTLQLVADSHDKGWKTRSVQAAKL